MFSYAKVIQNDSLGCTLVKGHKITKTPPLVQQLLCERVLDLLSSDPKLLSFTGQTPQKAVAVQASSRGPLSPQLLSVTHTQLSRWELQATIKIYADDSVLMNPTIFLK